MVFKFVLVAFEIFYINITITKGESAICVIANLNWFKTIANGRPNTANYNAVYANVTTGYDKFDRFSELMESIVRS